MQSAGNRDEGEVRGHKGDGRATDGSDSETLESRNHNIAS